MLVWFALMLVMLIGFAGFAVDVSNWWLQAERLQRAADAGAHAGVVFLPADLPTARTTARSEIAKNGYRTTGATPDATATITQEPNPNTTDRSAPGTFARRQKMPAASGTMHDTSVTL